MYEYIEGNCVGSGADYVVIDVGGIGYRIIVAKHSALGLAEGKKMRVWVDCVIREDSHTLYGFVSTQDRDFFRLLQQVSGIGPRLAVTMVASVQVPQLAEAIFRRDIALLSSIPGIGKKLAERLAMELQDKVQAAMSQGTIVHTQTSELAHQAIVALHTLGLSHTEAREAVLMAQQRHPDCTNVGTLVQQALSMKR